MYSGILDAFDDGAAFTWVPNVVATAMLILGVALLRWFLAARVGRSSIESVDLRRRWLVQVRNGCFLLLLVGATAIWSAELRNLALSLVAILVAIVLATKELILCLTGSLLKTRAGSFTIGDRIEVGNARGEVVDQTLLTTRLAELGVGASSHLHTGRMLTIPNSLFLTTPVGCQSAMGGYVLSTMVVPVSGAGANSLQAAEDRLVEAAREVCDPYLAEAQAQVDTHTQKDGLATMDAGPRITVFLVDPTRVDLALRIASPAGQVHRAQQDILRRYLASTPASTS